MFHPTKAKPNGEGHHRHRDPRFPGIRSVPRGHHRATHEDTDGLISRVSPAVPLEGRPGALWRLPGFACGDSPAIAARVLAWEFHEHPKSVLTMKEQVGTLLEVHRSPVGHE